MHMGNIAYLGHIIESFFHDLDISGQDRFLNVAGWERYTPHGLGHVSWVGSVLFVHQVQILHRRLPWLGVMGFQGGGVW